MSDLFAPPFGTELLKKRKKIRRELMEKSTDFMEKRVAILGGSTTHDITDVLELFLLSHGIRASFYESEYAQYWQDAMFSNPELERFRPDVIYICTSVRNVSAFPSPTDGAEEMAALLEAEYGRFSAMWERLAQNYRCPVIQNNFEYPYWRLMGNADAVRGRVNFVTRLNLKFAEYAASHDNFFIHDINYLSASYGLEAWSDPFYWHMYKYALSMSAIPYLAQSVANIIKSLYGKNKKAFALDLDNTLWGGIVGDDGPENIQVGQETSVGQAYSEFQEYLKLHKRLGVILNVVSKNDPENALAGLNRPGMTLTPDDFIMIKANWEPKAQNLKEIAQTLSLGEDSFVFVDDNPAEREIVREYTAASAPDIGDAPEKYIRAIDRIGYFEVTALSADDAARNRMYRENAARNRAEASFTDYGEYLDSLNMDAEIRPFSPMYLSRIAQLTNKSNQFNLTTRRYTQAEIEAVASDAGRIALYGKLSDKFGDNGVVSVIIGAVSGEVCDVELWLMSCRVLKRGMEDAMMDELVRQCRARGVKRLRASYYPTAKNAMVRNFYESMGMTLERENERGDKFYSLSLEGYASKSRHIRINGGKAR